MKEIFRFLAWQWSKWEFWQKCFILTAPFLGASLALPEPWASWVGLIPMLTVFGFMVKWFIVDGIKSAWAKYKAERNQLFDTIKDSDC